MARQHTDRKKPQGATMPGHADTWGSLVGKQHTELEMWRYFTRAAITKYYLRGGLVVLYSRYPQLEALLSKLLKHTLPTPPTILTEKSCKVEGSAPHFKVIMCQRNKGVAKRWKPPDL